MNAQLFAPMDLYGIEGGLLLLRVRGLVKRWQCSVGSVSEEWKMSIQ